MQFLKYLLVIPIVLFSSNLVFAQPIDTIGHASKASKITIHVYKYELKKKQPSTTTKKPAKRTTPTKSSKPTQTSSKPSQSNPTTNTTQSSSTNKPTAKSTTQTATDSASISAVEQEVVHLVNVERANKGLKPLTIDNKLCKVAHAKSQDMATNNYFDHQSPTYGSPFDMMHQFGVSFQAAGENIAAGQQTAAQVMNGWMNSQGHRENILNPAFTHIGVGYVTGGSYGTYWTQEFTD